MKKDTTNVFSGGLTYDLNPLTTPNNVLTDATNCAFITFNGDELSLQNDAGNATLDAYLERGVISEYDSGTTYTLGNVVSLLVTIYDPENSGMLYYQNINSNRVKNPNFTSTTTQWVLTDDLTVDLQNNTTINTIKLVFPTTPETISQKLALVKGHQYNLQFYAKTESNVTSPTYYISHYNYNGDVIGSPTMITVVSNTTTSIDFTVPVPDLLADPPESDYRYSTFSHTASASMATDNNSYIGLFELSSTGYQLVENTPGVPEDGSTLTATGLDNPEVWLDITKVALSAGFYPLAVKEYGGVLYIISGKKGLNEGGDEIEFGSYPSPVVVDPTTYAAVPTAILTPDDLKLDKYLGTQNFDPGFKAHFDLTLTTGDLADITHYDKNTGEWVRSLYKLGLYQKLEHSTRDITREFDYLSTTGYWVNSSADYFNSSFYKGKIFARIEIEPIEYFRLESSTLARNLTTLEWNLEFSYLSLCRLNINNIKVDYSIYSGETKVFPLATDWETEIIPTGWVNSITEETLDTSTTSPVSTIIIADATNYIGCTLRYIITPQFGVDLSTDVLTGDEIIAYTSEYIINASRVIPDAYELVDLKYEKLVVELSNPLATTYEYNDPITDGLETCIELSLVDEENRYLDSTLALSGNNVSAFSLFGATGIVVAELLGIYKIEESGITSTVAPAFPLLASIAARIPFMTLQSKSANALIEFQINYSAQTLSNSIKYLAAGTHTTIQTTNDITIYADPYPRLLVDSYDTPTEGLIAYDLLGVYKTYTSGSWQAYDEYRDIWNYRTMKGDLQIGYMYSIPASQSYSGDFGLYEEIITPDYNKIYIANYAGLVAQHNNTSRGTAGSGNILRGKPDGSDYKGMTMKTYIGFSFPNTIFGKISGTKQVYNATTNAAIGSPTTFTNVDCWFDYATSNSAGYSTSSAYAIAPYDTSTYNYYRLTWNVASSLGGNVTIPCVNYWEDVAADEYYYIYDCTAEFNNGETNIVDDYVNIDFPERLYTDPITGIVMAHTFNAFNDSIF